jgi:tumor protein p53-inducible protein 3
MMKFFQYDKTHKKFLIQSTTLPKPKCPSHVIMDILGFGINRADILQKNGLYPPPKGTSEILGLEVVGKINHPDFDKNKIYTSIIPGGAYAEKCIVHKNHLIPFSSSFSLSDLAGIPEVFLTAFQLIEYADIQGHLTNPISDDPVSVYVPAGASGVGTTLIQLLRNLYPGIKIYASVSTNEKQQKCLELGADYVVNYKTEGYEKLNELIKENTKSGLDAVFDCLGPGQADSIVKLLRPEATWVVYSMLTGMEVSNSKILASIFRKKIVMVNTMLRSRSDQYKTELVSRFKDKCYGLIEQGKVGPIIFKEVSLSFDLEGASLLDDLHGIMENNLNIGKLVVLLK